ncbi:uncharacterized protein LOC119677212 [Teleopsis dalmanni]|uniref:uncharacterized protein LOC119677212 n=1 Tax=Teleopsis dalmanni TaxID=139649 RepID=UPI0018CD8D84|nr:uncharacterized protein LOC119677212 [Teleopsis dalmanni]
MSENSRILEWLEKISDDLNEVRTSRESTPIVQPLQEYFVPHSENVVNVLKKTVNGQLVLSFHEKNGHLDTKNQKVLTHCIVDQYVRDNVKMTYSDMRQWAAAICEVFPKEKSVVIIYFCEKKCWLQHNCSPWETVRTFWKETSAYRISNLKSDDSLSTFFDEWPRLTDFNGYELVRLHISVYYVFCMYLY